MILDLSSLEKAISSFNSALNVALSKQQMEQMSEAAQKAVKAGVIQNFEFTYELSWKFMKRRLEIDLGSVYVDGLSRKELFRLAVENHLIADVDTWLDYHDCRNETSHTYDEKTAEEVFAGAVKFVKDAEILLAKLKAKNA
ncbi:nucleotidyltransferase substrate binding protein [Candidatus Saganbacteria bacterium]|nr:nucleotidyltransferase substrate binding protein [Candidatus Saganbacteria bacterium]